MIRVAVFPPSWQPAPDPRDKARMMEAVIEELRKTPSLEVADSARTRESAEREAGCEDDLSCVRRVGRSLSASKILVIKVAELGTTALARASLLDVAGGAQEQVREKLVERAAPAAIEAAVIDLGSALARPLGPAEPAPSGRSWTWVVAGGAVLLAGIAGALWARQEAAGPDVIITPP
jgi:hypothetical protein